MVSELKLDNYAWFYREPTETVSLCGDIINLILGSRPHRIKVTASKKAFLGSKKVKLVGCNISFGKIKASCHNRLEDFIKDNNLDPIFYAKIEAIEEPKE